MKPFDCATSTDIHTPSNRIMELFALYQRYRHSLRSTNGFALNVSTLSVQVISAERVVLARIAAVPVKKEEQRTVLTGRYSGLEERKALRDQGV